MSLIIINFFELLAAVAGIVYLRKGKVDKGSMYFVYFLWFTVGVEIILGWLPTLIYYNEKLFFLRDTIWYENHWVYNIYDIVSFSAYLLYFRYNITDLRYKKILQGLLVTFLIGAVVNLFIHDIFTETPVKFTFVFGSVLLLLSVLFYFFEILKNDMILNFKRILTFYIAVGALVFHLCVPPLFIYLKYYILEKSPEFVKLFDIVLTSANIFMYTCYALGFIICSQKKNIY